MTQKFIELSSSFFPEVAVMRFSNPLYLSSLIRPRTLALSVSMALSPMSAFAVIGQAPSLQQAQQIVASVRNQGQNLGLASGANLLVTSAMKNPQGVTIVRADHTFQGHRVWGSTALIHADPKRSPQLYGNSLMAAAIPTGTPVISKERAIAIAEKKMALKGKNLPTRAELVVFPTQLMGDIQLNWDKKQKRFVLDRQRSVMTEKPSDAYVWAYEVCADTRNRIDGIQSFKYVIDARTGAILNVGSNLKTLAGPNPPTYSPDAQAVVGTGNGQYSGMVQLNTSRYPDGSYWMIDQTHGSTVNPSFSLDYLVNDDGMPFRDNNGNPISVPGLMTITSTREGFGDPYNGGSFTGGTYWYSNLSNQWGDGKQIVQFPYGSETTANGESAAVDAHYGLGVALDFYKNIFNRDGIDGAGTSTFAIVHQLSPGDNMAFDNAYWSDFFFGMFYGDGSKNASVDPYTGEMVPGNPLGFGSLTALDIAGHELTHGVTSRTSNLFYEGESGGMNEGTSDIFGKMIEAYEKRTSGTDNIIPNNAITWRLGGSVGAPGTALRDMDKPSLDGLSADNWFDGIRFLDVHFSSGPLNRMFYMLSQGASTSVAARDYSRYLPNGMTGIGNDKAARIWYKAVTEYMGPYSQYTDGRVAAIAAARTLYGANSPEIIAVRKAFAAINVGQESDEMEPRVKVSIPLFQPPGTPLNPEGGSGYFSRIPIVSMGTSVQAVADVKNTDNKEVFWKIGGQTGSRFYNGVIGADGRWTPGNNFGFHAMTVISKADLTQYAEGRVWVVNGDADGDTEFDAIDFGDVAASWALSGGYVKASHAIVGDGFVDSMDVTAIVEAFKRAFGGK
jgi:Zn-dependent metalloprotease